MRACYILVPLLLHVARVLRWIPVVLVAVVRDSARKERRVCVARALPVALADDHAAILTFPSMKLHCRKHGDKELSDEVNQCIANLQNLAKHGLVSAEFGFNSVLKDIQLELEARGRRKVRLPLRSSPG